MRDFGSSSVTSPLDQVLEKGRSRTAGLPITSFCEARLLLELRVLAYGLSLTDRPTAVPPRTKLRQTGTDCPPPDRPTAVHEMQSPEPTELEIA